MYCEKNNREITCEVRCNKHIGWFNSPIYFGSPELFKAVVTQGNRVTCKFGGELINCDKSNMRYRYKNENGVIMECYYTQDDDGNDVLKERPYTEDGEDT